MLVQLQRTCSEADMGTIKDLEKRVDGHELRISAVEVAIVEGRADRKWMRVIGGAIVAGMILLGTLIWDTNSRVNFIAAEHEVLSQERHSGS